MFSVKKLHCAIKYFICAVLLFATVLSLSACVDVDSFLESLIEGEGQVSSAPDRGEKDDVSAPEDESVVIPETAADLFVVSDRDSISGLKGVAIEGYTGTEALVKIPTHIEGKPVLAVYKNAFSDRVDEDGTTSFAVTELIVPHTVEVIEYGAFANCQKLIAIELPFIGGTDGDNNFAYIFGERGVPQSLQNVRAGGLTVADEAFEDCENLISIEFTVAENVGNGAFKNCTALKTVVLPKTVTEMGMNLFQGCEKLETLTLPFLGNGNDVLFVGSIFGAGSYADNISVMPETLRNLTVYWEGSIPNKAFYECDRLVNLTFKGNISTVGNYSFYRCRRLKTLSFECDEGFEGVSVLGDNAFAYCGALGSVALSAEVQLIPDFCFYSCSSLRTISFGGNDNVIPDGVLFFGESAFAYCESLVSLKLPSAVTELPVGLFEGCSYLSEIVIPAEVEFIGDKVFSGCTNLNAVSFENGSILASLGDSVFAYCTLLKEISLPDSIESMGEYTFSHCWSLKSAKLPADLSSVPAGCFFGCTYLQKVEYNQSSVTEIGMRAFSGCEKITSLSLSDNIQNIGKYAFDECGSLVFTVKADSYAYTWLIGNGIGSKYLNLVE